MRWWALPPILFSVCVVVVGMVPMTCDVDDIDCAV